MDLSKYGIPDGATFEDLVRIVSDEEVFQKIMKDLEGLVTTTHSGGYKWNPLWQAELAERLQYDGDVPEARIGPLPPGQMPAIPVLPGDTLSSIFIGTQVYKAAQGLLEQMESESTDLVLYDPPAYPRYKEALPVKSEISSSDWLVPLDQARKSIWTASATTQGRVSSALAIEKALFEQYPLPKASSSNDAYEWRFRLSEEKDINPFFDPVRNAYAAFQKRLEKGDIHAFRIVPINDIPNRSVGWRMEVTTKALE